MDETKTPPTAEAVESIHATTATIIADNAGKVNTFVCLQRKNSLRGGQKNADGRI